MQDIPPDSVDNPWFPGCSSIVNSQGYFEISMLKGIMGKKEKNKKQCTADAKSTLTVTAAKKNLLSRDNSYTL